MFGLTNATAWAAVIAAAAAVGALVLGVIKDVNARQDAEERRAAKRRRDDFAAGYHKRQDEIQNRVMGQLDTALAFCGGQQQGEIRRLLTSVQNEINKVTVREGSDDDDGV